MYLLLVVSKSRWWLWMVGSFELLGAWEWEGDGLVVAVVMMIGGRA